MYIFFFLDQIVIEATRGKGWRGDIAIDDIEFHQEHCVKVVVYVKKLFRPNLVTWKSKRNHEWELVHMDNNKQKSDTNTDSHTNSHTSISIK